MKHFKKDTTCNGYKVPGIVFKNIFSVSEDNGKIVIYEECDGHFREELDPNEAIELFQEAIDFIKDLEKGLIMNYETNYSDIKVRNLHEKDDYVLLEDGHVYAWVKKEYLKQCPDEGKHGTVKIITHIAYEKGFI